MLSVENRFVHDQKVGLEKEVKLLEKDGNVRNKIKLGVPYPKVPVTEEVVAEAAAPVTEEAPAEEAAPEVVAEVEAPKEETPEAPAAETTEEKA